MTYTTYECDYCGDYVTARCSDDIEGWGTAQAFACDVVHACPKCRESEGEFNDLQL